MKFSRGVFKFSASLLIISILIVGVSFLKSKLFPGNPKISIVIPIYNTEKYLDDCLTSVENQTFRNIEIICVNDGSTDNSEKIIENYKSKDKRIKVITQENKGLSMARNSGMDIAKGDYILFFDSDDIISPSLCECVYKVSLNHKDAEIIQFNETTFHTGDKINFTNVNFKEEESSETTRNSNENPFEKLNASYNVVWNKIYKTSFLRENNLRFEKDVSPGEDMLFNYFALNLCKKTVFNKNTLYWYRRGRPGSIMSTKDIKRNQKSCMIIFERILESHDKFNFDGAENWSVNESLSYMYGIITSIIKDPEDKKYYAKRTSELLTSYINKYNYKPSEIQQKQIDKLIEIANQQ